MTGSPIKKVYRVFRSIAFSLLLGVGILYVLLYISLSLSPVQNRIKELAEKEFNSRSDGRLSIGTIDISPFNEVRLGDVGFISPEGDTVVKVNTIGAGINLRKLILNGKIQLTYAELISIEAKIVQEKKDAPLNVQFIVDAFNSKESKNEPTKFDLELNNIVIRKANISFDRLWTPVSSDKYKLDFNHLKVRKLAADLRFPNLSNDDVAVDVRRLSFDADPGLNVQKISGLFHVSNEEISFKDLQIRLPWSHIHPEDMSLHYDGYKDIVSSLKREPLRVVLHENMITPSDFRVFLPSLSHCNQTFNFSADLLKTGDNLKIDKLELRSGGSLDISSKGFIASAFNPFGKEFLVKLDNVSLQASGVELGHVMEDFSPLSERANSILMALGDVNLDSAVTASRTEVDADGEVSTGIGDVLFKGSVRNLGSRSIELQATLKTSEINVGRLLPESPVSSVMVTAAADVKINGKEVDGLLDAEVESIVLRGVGYENFTAHVVKEGSAISGNATMQDPELSFDIEADATLQGFASHLSAVADVKEMDFSLLSIPGLENTQFSGNLSLDLTGNSLDNAEGFVEANNLVWSNPKTGNWKLNNIRVLSERTGLPQSLTVNCDYFNLVAEGEFALTKIPGAFLELLSSPMPELVPAKFNGSLSAENLAVNLTVFKDSELLRRFRLPVTLLEDLDVNAEMNSTEGTAMVDIKIPYLQMGKDKLIRNTALSFTLDNPEDVCNLSFSSQFPGNKGPATVMLEANAHNSRIDTDISWIMDRKTSYRGLVSLSTALCRTATGSLALSTDINPSAFEVNDSIWNIGHGAIDYVPGKISVSDIRVGRQNQWATIHGSVSSLPDDTLDIELNDIDLDYIFETLAINYVVFGGNATGNLRASELFSKHPRLYTDNLYIRDFTYNHALMGNASVSSFLDTQDNVVRINALIDDEDSRVAEVEGGIWVARDSLSFDFDARHLEVKFLKPFVSAFCDDISGHATGKAKLYGTFKDINLAGKVFAEDVKMKIGVTNTEYSATDTVLITPGRINLDNITLHDREGHTALLNGYVAHEYFHNPSFRFSISNAKDFLCYDTDAALNPVWYGTIYANGGGTITGVPGFIDVLVDMTTASNSTFTFVIDDKEEAIDYQFLTFTDKRKEAEELRMRELTHLQDTIPEFVKRFEKNKHQAQNDLPTRYKMDLRINATPDAKAIIVMDPAAGDKIRATGEGALRFTYNSEGEIGLYGTYTIDRGDYNFTLQELIVRDFKIRRDSKITFTGNPLNATLDITAAYRVNASLTDLDKSFATDNDVSRNKVPVEALLRISGNMQGPDIDFDIDLPTLSQDVARKVRSIVSTSDMMNLQMVYLLALNRFYTPDYMNNNSGNNEMASLASATLSTQLGNILGQISDNWSFAPSFRTEKGDFSDMEVDLALSSTLLNNRLILNGNLGYRDKATSNTTFVGDFDIEYLLNRKGTIRLKAYNHYNDQNYYLRSALTTQGIGIVFKRDFNDFLPGLFGHRKKSDSKSEQKDTVASNDSSTFPSDTVKSTDFLIIK